jgi:RNA polymerase subunit RPABC4/transcription elongation factor Spt4
LKYVKLALFVCAFIFATVALAPEETHAAGYEATWDGMVIYLSKAEASKMAQSMETNANWGLALGVVGIWLPDSVYKKAVATGATLSQFKFRTAATDLRNCSARGATVTLPWVGIGALINFKVRSR